jgi:hypothetical protein
MLYLRLLHIVCVAPRALDRGRRSAMLPNRNRSALLPQFSNMAGKLNPGKRPAQAPDPPQPIRQHFQRPVCLVVGGMLTRYALRHNAKMIAVHCVCLQCCFYKSLSSFCMTDCRAWAICV